LESKNLHVDEVHRIKRTARHEKRKGKRYNTLEQGSLTASPQEIDKTHYTKDIVSLKRLGNYLSRISAQSRPFVAKYRTARQTVVLPEIFDLRNNTEATLKSIYSICYNQLDPRVRRLTINHHEVAQLGFSAESLLSFLVLECDDYNKRRRIRKVLLDGNYPDSHNLQRMMNSAGLPNVLNANQGENSAGGEGDINVKRFIRRSFYSAIGKNETADDTKTLACIDVNKYLNQCLDIISRELNEDAESELGEYVGEILGNAEDHSGENLWFMSGYLDSLEESKHCNILIFNFGHSISETFTNLDKNHYSWDVVKGYVKANKEYGFSRDELITVAALQENISSKNESDDDHRGQGTIDCLDFFQKVSEECIGQGTGEARMTLISGKVKIKFDANTKVTMVGERKIIPLNAENDINLPPERTYISSLSGVSFPGTLIAISFPMGDPMLNVNE